MITLVRELYGRYFGRPRYNLLVVGLDGQGKTVSSSFTDRSY